MSFCGAVLACALSWMHWTVATDTTYTVERTTTGYSTSTVLIVNGCAVLSFLACPILWDRRIKLSTIHAQQLVFACAYFDESDKLMVTQESGLPCKKVIDRFVEETLGEDELSRSHPTWKQLLTASRNWAKFESLVTGIMDRSNSGALTKYIRVHETSIWDTRSELESLFSTAFTKTLLFFC